MKPRVALALCALLLLALPLVIFLFALEPSATKLEGAWTAYKEGQLGVQVPTPGWWVKVFLVLLLVAFSGVYFHGRAARTRR
jgi:hypothetical protein